MDIFLTRILFQTPTKEFIWKKKENGVNENKLLKVDIFEVFSKQHKL